MAVGSVAGDATVVTFACDECELSADRRERGDGVRIIEWERFKSVEDVKRGVAGSDIMC